MSRKKKVIIISSIGNGPGEISTEELPGEGFGDPDAEVSVVYKDAEVSDAAAEAALNAAVAELES